VASGYVLADTADKAGKAHKVLCVIPFFTSWLSYAVASGYVLADTTSFFRGCVESSVTVFQRLDHTVPEVCHYWVPVLPITYFWRIFFLEGFGRPPPLHLPLTSWTSQSTVGALHKHRNV
jgi:hypothetical protein